MLDQPVFPGKATAVAGEGSVGTDHTVAGNHEGNEVHAVGPPRGAGRAGATQVAGHAGIAARFTVRNGLEVAPGCEFEGRADRGERKIELKTPARKVRRELLRCGFQVRVGPGNDRTAQPGAQRGEFAFKSAAVGEVEHHESRVGGETEHGAERRGNPVGKQGMAAVRLTRGHAKDPVEGRSKPARRFETAGKLRVGDAGPVLDLAPGQTQPLRPRVGLEGHAVVPFELAPRRGGVDAEGEQILLAQALRRVVFDRLLQPQHEGWRSH